MEKEKVNSFINNLNIIGLTDNDIDELAYWYSSFTYRRSKGYRSGSGYTSGSPIIDNKARRKGLMFLGNVLNNLDDFDSPLTVESLMVENKVSFKCTNKKKENLVVIFSPGDSIDFPTVISIIGSENVTIAKIMLDKGIVFDKLSYYNISANSINESYKNIYESAYSETNNFKKN